jgi:hypothetical protein
MKRIIIGLLTVFALVIGASGCSTVSTEPDEVALHYSGGSFSSKNFKDCVESSNRQTDGAGDAHYIYPKGQRTYSFTGAEGSERNPLAVTTGSQEILIPGFVTFTLNTDCKVLREFHEKVGNKYKAYKDGGGWDDFLNDYIAVPLSATLNKAAGSIETPEGKSRDQNWELLYNDAATQDAFEDYVKENLPGEIEQTLGGVDGAQFITVNEVSIAKPEINDDLKTALQSKEKARLENDAQKERNTTAKTQYETLSDCLDTGIGKEACTVIFLSQNGADIPFIPIPQGGSVNYAPVQ